MSKKHKILFLCTGNSCRSQMAEGFCHHYLADTLETISAGILSHGLNPMAVRVMKEIGIDISQHHSKTIEELGIQEFDYVITVCDHAKETCPYMPGKIKTLHRGFDDPPNLALSAKSEEEALKHYRRVRDEIKEYVLSLPQLLMENKNFN